MKILIALLLVFAIYSHVNSVSAECAWVLWVKERITFLGDSGRPNWDHPNPDHDSWKISEVVATMVECQDQLNEFRYNAERESKAAFVSKYPRSNTGLAYSRKPNDRPKPGDIYSVVSRLLCVPDTVDPRERK